MIFISLSATDELSPPLSLFPQVTTVPSSFNAANALSVEKIVLILVNFLDINELFTIRLPQVITVPSVFNAAKVSQLFQVPFVCPGKRVILDELSAIIYKLNPKTKNSFKITLLISFTITLRI